MTRLTDRHKTIPYFKRVLVSSDTWGRSNFFPDCQKWGNQGEEQKLYRYIVFVTKFESSTVHQPAAIEVLAVDDQRATEVHARIYEHRPISSSFGRGSETET
nr:hypothetical protein [Burkholderia cenocepacia]